MTRRRLGVGLIGIGWMGRLHARAYRALPEHYPDLGVAPELVIAADPVPQQRSGAVDVLGFRAACEDYRDVLAHPGVDVVSICSPNFLHQELALAAAASGKPLWLEKPMGRDARESRAITEAVVGAGLVSCVGFNYRQAPAVVHLGELVRTKQLGEVVSVRVALLADYSADPAGPRSWRYVRDRAGSGVLGDLLSHGVDLAQEVAGPISAVAAMTKTVVDERPAPVEGPSTHFGGAGTTELLPVENEDHAVVLARFASGAIGTLEASRVSVGSRCDYGLEVRGTRGSARWNLERMNELQVCRGPAAAEYGFTTVYMGPEHGDFQRFQPGGGLTMGFDDLKTIEAARFVASVLQGRQLAPSVHDGLAVALVLDAAERSAAGRTWVDVARMQGASITTTNSQET
jgi:predicted dehydrogenase